MAGTILPNERLIKQAYGDLDNALHRIAVCMTLLEKDTDDNPDARKAMKLILYDALEELTGLRAILPVVLPAAGKRAEIKPN